MLFHITQVHTPETCPKDEGGSNSLFNPNVPGLKLICQLCGPTRDHSPPLSLKRRGHLGRTRSTSEREKQNLALVPKVIVTLFHQKVDDFIHQTKRLWRSQ